MARLGSIPVKIPENVEVRLEPGLVVVKGPKGEVKRSYDTHWIEVKKTDEGLIVEMLKENSRTANTMQGTMRAHLDNMVKGVIEGWKKSLEVVGAGYRASTQGNKLTLTVGYSHPVDITIPEGLSVTVEKNIINLEGADKELVGQMAANIRDKRPPEPYKGAGIKYTDEVIRRKAGKQAGKAEA